MLRTGEVVDVGGDHGPPARSHRSREAAAGVGQGHRQHAAVGEQRPDPVERSAGVRQVLDHVSEEDGVEGAVAEVGLEQVVGAHVEAELLAGVSRGEGARLDPERSQPRSCASASRKPDPAAEVEQAAAIGVASIARGPRRASRAGRPPPRRSRGTRPRRRQRRARPRSGIRSSCMCPQRAQRTMSESAVPKRSVVGIRPSGPASPPTREVRGETAPPQAAQRPVSPDDSPPTLASAAVDTARRVVRRGGPRRR